MDHILKDSRFSHIPVDPRFKRIPKWERKVKIDKRFQRMFKDDKFKVKYTTDKRGRPANTTSAEDLKRYYAISSDEEDSDESGKEEERGEREGEEGTSRVNKSSPPTLKSKKVVKPQSKKGNNSKSSKRLSAVSTDGNREETDTVKSDSNSDSHVGALPRKDNSSSDDDEGIDLSSRRLLPEGVKKKLCDLSVDYARGEGTLFTDSSSDEESTGDEADSESDVEHRWGELDKDAATTEEASRRLAICNMDWDRIRAQDLLVLLSSFLPTTGGAICSVTIYPSEFGIERMKEEEVNGPSELRESKRNDNDADLEEEQDDENDEETEEGRKYHMEKLRQYQLNRLRYYYAVVECDSVATAEHLYSECDGLEYESSATRLDLRFIPNDMTFDQEPHDSCNSLPEPGQYSPQQFTTTALQQAKVDLTWDETDPKRVALAKKLQSAELNDLPDADLQAYLASDTSEDSAQEEEAADDAKEAGKSDEEADVDPVLKYRQLLLEVEQQENERKKKNEGVEMEVTWGLGLEDKTKKLIKERQKAASLEQATPFQQILEKRKEKRKLKREQRKKLQNGENGSGEESDDQRPFSDDDVPSDVDMNDPFFREEMDNLGVKGKKKVDKKRKKGGSDLDEDEEEKQGKAELELLMLDEEPSDKKHFSLKKIQEAEEQSKKKKKRLKKKKTGKEQPGESVEDDFQVNVNDERFQALFTSHHYNIDPADPHYRKTKGTEALRQAKLSRWTHENENEAQSSTTGGVPPPTAERQKSRRDAELSQLVKSVKRNTQNLKK